MESSYSGYGAGKEYEKETKSLGHVRERSVPVDQVIASTPSFRSITHTVNRY